VSRTGLLDHASFLLHDNGPGHPERPERLLAVIAHLERTGLLAELDRREPGPAPTEALAAVHSPDYLRRVEETAGRGGSLDDPDTSASEGSFEAARRAAGAVVEACDRVMAGEWRNAFVAARPPGHHAEVGRAMGFCLFNNAAIAARHLQQKHGLRRIAILDWDVHHGNGTQHVFEEDGSVFFASLHQFPHYPGTGAATERGRGAGAGTTLNLPQAAGSGDREWIGALEDAALPALLDFAPEFLIVSAGFDAHAEDPLSATELSIDGFRLLSERAVELARRACGGRLVSCLEGGYHLDALAHSAAAHVEVLLEAGR
jgi:acetoin utilization deacetylase AcuC-like enzyme